jgi:hypothetical protein
MSSIQPAETLKGGDVSMVALKALLVLAVSFLTMVRCRQGTVHPLPAQKFVQKFNELQIQSYQLHPRSY